LKGVLPGNQTFTAADAGRYTFSVTFKTKGKQSLTANDLVLTGINGTLSSITVS
jgi:hypothetical protein